MFSTNVNKRQLLRRIGLEYSVFGIFKIAHVEISRKPTRHRLIYQTSDAILRAGFGTEGWTARTYVHHYFQYHLVAASGPGILAMSHHWNYL